MNVYGNKVVTYLLWRLVLARPRFRKFVQSLVYPNKDIPVTVLGATLTINPQKELGYWRAARNQHSNIVFRDEMPQMLGVLALLSNDSTFVDCGANVGLWTCNVARLRAVHPNLRVLAFEANPDTFRRLQKSISGFDNVQAICCALSDGEHQLRMFEAAGSGAFGVHYGSFQIPGSDRMIAAKPLDAFIGGLNNMVVKIDVEGHELEVLRGAGSALQRGAIRAILIDCFIREAEQNILQALREGGLTQILNGRTLRPFQAGNDSVLAMRPVSRETSAPVEQPAVVETLPR
jgi:FkbM family methyltransferase